MDLKRINPIYMTFHVHITSKKDRAWIERFHCIFDKMLFWSIFAFIWRGSQWVLILIRDWKEEKWLFFLFAITVICRKLRLRGRHHCKGRMFTGKKNLPKTLNQVHKGHINYRHHHPVSSIIDPTHKLFRMRPGTITV